MKNGTCSLACRVTAIGKKEKQAEAEVVPSSSLVEVEVEVGVEVGVEVEVEVMLGFIVTIILSLKD